MPRHANYIPHGVIPAVLLPFDNDLAIDEQSFRKHLRDVASVEGLSAITINAHSTEVGSCTFDEQRRVLEIAQEEIGAKLPLINGIWADSSIEAARLARMATLGGASALLVFPPTPFALGQSPQMALGHFKRIADATDLPLIVFQYPLATGQGYPKDTLLKLSKEVPTIRAIKDWIGNVPDHQWIWTHKKNFAQFNTDVVFRCARPATAKTPTSLCSWSALRHLSLLGRMRVSRLSRPIDPASTCLTGSSTSRNGRRPLEHALTIAMRGVFPFNAICSRRSESLTRDAVPAMRTTSRRFGTMKMMPTLGFSRTLRNVSARWLPSRSGIASVCLSRTFTKPAGSPFGETSIDPAALMLEMTIKGYRSIHFAQCSSM
jgi:hypothetical protein